MAVPVLGSWAGRGQRRTWIGDRGRGNERESGVTPSLGCGCAPIVEHGGSGKTEVGVSGLEQGEVFEVPVALQALRKASAANSDLSLCWLRAWHRLTPKIGPRSLPEVNSEEFHRTLTRVTRLATAARERIDDLGRDLKALRTAIEELGAAFDEKTAAPQDETTKNGTLDSNVTQVEVVTK